MATLHSFEFIKLCRYNTPFCSDRAMALVLRIMARPASISKSRLGTLTFRRKLIHFLCLGRVRAATSVGLEHIPKV
jgi:hypothetical protein